MDFKEHVFGDWSVRAVCDDRVRLARGRAMEDDAVHETLTLDDVEALIDVLNSAKRDARQSVEVGEPYYGKALRVSAKATTTVRALQRWSRTVYAHDYHYSVDNAFYMVRTEGHSTETHRPSIEALMQWLAENPGHPFDVLICDAADMPEWNPDAAAGEVSE